MEVAKIDNLPAGKWLIELSFGVTFGNWSGGWVYYNLIFAGNPLVASEGVYTSSSNNANSYPLSVTDRYIVTSTGNNQPLLFRGKPYPQSSPTYRNIIVTATKLE